MNQTNSDDTTRERLLTQAEILFAQKGFHAVSVRDITTSAKTNLAAVNYHFGNKMNLYLAVFKERMIPRTKRMRECFLGNLPKTNSPGIDDVFGALANAFLDGPFSEQEKKLHSQLMQRELTYPTDAFEMLLEETIGPFHTNLKTLLKAHLPDTVSDDSLALCIHSMFAVVLFFDNARELVNRLTGSHYDREFKSRLVAHIAEFSNKGFGVLYEEGSK